MKSLISKFLCLMFSALLILMCAGCSADTEEFNLVSDASLEDSRYFLGDTMGDYTVTDVNGVSHSFSEILDTKKAIVLNFWFINCGPCRMEFPYLEEAYGNFKDDIEVLAINPIGDSEADIKAFSEEFGLNFPVISGDENWNYAMTIQGYPTTVVIDRTGTVSFIHTGYVDSTETFERIFEFFTDDGYTPTLVENISDIK